MKKKGEVKNKEKGEENPNPNEQKEGHNLLGKPKFKKLENGRFKCVQTGHELPEHAKDTYAESKHCRVGLIDYALARNKPPLNMFNQDPTNRSKLICKLTGDTVNKSEMHIWKHMSGKRFFNMLEKEEAEKEMENGTKEKQDEVKENKKNEDGDLKKKKQKKKDKKKKKKKINQEEEHVDEIINGGVASTSKSSDAEGEDGFWMPPAGERWDQDDGGDRWGSESESESEPESDDAGGDGISNGAPEEADNTGAEEVKDEAGELSKKAKRLSLEIGPRKKKKTSVE